jgi:hypothetical protein
MAPRPCETIMIDSPKRMDVQAAAGDLRRRTLADLPRPLDRLIYLASMRDYNTGMYYHDGLAARFSQDAACEALAGCHREAFRELVSSSLENLVGQLAAYRDSSHLDPAAFVNVWKGLEPYRVAVPAETDSLAVDFLLSNLKIALAILEAHQTRRSTAGPGASPHPSPVR